MRVLFRNKYIILLIVLIINLFQSVIFASECENWEARHPEWIWCEDFDKPAWDMRAYISGVPILANAKNGTGYTGKGLKIVYQPDQEEQGKLWMGFGLSPLATIIRPAEYIREIYYRHYIKLDSNWIGCPHKLTRATVFSNNTMGQAMIAHLWNSEANGYLALDPVRCTNNGYPICPTYNDFDHMSWLGYARGNFQIFGPQNNGVWYNVECHVKLNTPGENDGIHEFWINGNLEARIDGLNFVDDYQTYGINAVMLENYSNSDGPDGVQSRYWDNFVISS
jgi:hypothetical protein